MFCRLVSEDAHHHFAAVMHRLHDMLCVGDYVVADWLHRGAAPLSMFLSSPPDCVVLCLETEVEDTSAQMQDWFEANIDEEDVNETLQARHIVNIRTSHLDMFSCALRSDMSNLVRNDSLGRNRRRNANSPKMESNNCGRRRQL